MSVMIEVPTLVLDSGAAAVAITLIGGAFAGVVVMIDYAFDRVKASAWNYINARLDLEKDKRGD